MVVRLRMLPSRDEGVVLKYFQILMDKRKYNYICIRIILIMGIK